jgi:transcriptional regulator with XRE-family HTH domain
MVQAGNTLLRDAKEMGRRIRIIRADMDWTLRDLAKATGVSYASWSRYEAGDRFPPFETIVALADAIDTSADAILGPWPTRAWSKRPPPTARAA